MKWDLSSNRRSFLKVAALAGGLAFLFGLQRPAAAKPQQPSPQQEQSKGYRLTEHVKKYYETARL